MVERLSRLLDAVATEAARADVQAWLVGGCLRDALLGEPLHDIDIVVAGDHNALAQSLHARLGGAIARLSRQTIRLIPPHSADAAHLTLDSSALHGPTLADDLAHRDLRINAMALPLTSRAMFLQLVEGAAVDGAPTRSAHTALRDSLIDPLRGCDDLDARRIELASTTALSDDPGRILRAARLAAALDFQPSATFLAAAQRVAPALAILPSDRLRDEFAAILAGAHADVALALVHQTGALAGIVSNADGDSGTAHTLACIRLSNALHPSAAYGAIESPLFSDGTLLTSVRQWYARPQRDGRPPIVALRWGLLLHEASAAAAAQVATHVALSAEVRRSVSAASAALAWRARLAEALPTVGEQRRLFAHHGEAAVETLVAASICDQAYTSAQGHVSDADPSLVTQRATTILATFFADPTILLPPPLLNGADLIRVLGIPAGPALKPILAAIRNAQLDGAITTYSEAITLAQRLAAGAQGFPT